MNANPGTMVVERPQLSLLDRMATLVSWALAVALFLTVGRLAMQPDDPLGAVSVLASGNGLMMLIQAAALAGVTGAIATVIAGRRLRDVGTFAAALGFAVVSLGGATTERFLLQGTGRSASFEHGLALRFAIEATGWIVAMAVPVAVSAFVMYWCFGVRFGAGATRTRGIRHTLVTAAVGLAAMALLSAGLSSRAIQHGQVCFVVAAAVCFGVYVAHRTVPVLSVVWSMAAVGLMAVVAYLWAALRPAVAGLPPGIPSSQFMRVLPIQFISVGTAAAIGAFWYLHAPAPDDPGRAGRTSSQPGGSE